MEKINLTCEGCGSTLSKIEAEQDTYICLHCGRRNIIKETKSITNNNVQINQHIVKNIYGTEKEEFSELYMQGRAFLKIKEYKKAFRSFTKAVKINPSHYESWWELARVSVVLKEQGVMGLKLDYVKYYSNAITFAPEEEKAKIEKEYKNLTPKTHYSNDMSNLPANFKYKKISDGKALKIISIICFAFGIVAFIITRVLINRFNYTFLSKTGLLSLLSFLVLGLASSMLYFQVRKNYTSLKTIEDYIKDKDVIKIEDMVTYFYSANIEMVFKIQHESKKKLPDSYIKKCTNKEYVRNDILYYLRQGIIRGYICGYELQNNEKLIKREK